MSDLFAGWPPDEIIGLVAVIGTFLTLMVIAVSIVWYLHRRDALLANQKHDYLDRGFSVEQIEQLLRMPGPSPQDQEKVIEAELASLLAQHEVPAPAMERVLQLFKESEPASKKAIRDAIEEMLDADVREEQLLAAATALCGPRRESRPPALGAV
jgi:DNA-binding transcriptional MerR regulator